MKSVRFNEIVNVYPTYSRKEYDRHQIDSILYQKNYNRISIPEWNSILVSLDLYKLYEMPVHPYSLKNNSYKLKIGSNNNSINSYFTKSFQHFFQ